jgi:hypothetical protein
MSLSNPKMTNPATKFVEFKGDKGIFQYYDKTLDEPKNVELTMPFFFIVLDELSTISGYSDRYESAFYSNEVHSLSDEILKVKSFKGGFSVTGKYADIKNELFAAGAKFAKSIYAMLIKSNTEFELIHFKLTGAAFGAWIEKKFNTQQYGITVKSIAEGQKGAVKYKMPVFDKVNIPKEKIMLWETAIEMDRQLQVYLKAYKAGQIENMEIKEISENQIEVQPTKAVSQSLSDMPVDDLPF